MAENYEDRPDAELEAMFAAARSTSPKPSDDFVARLAQDMERALPRQHSAPIAVEGPTLLARLQKYFAASGLAGAAALGVWIGFVMPETLNTFADGFASEEAFDLEAFLPGTGLSELEWEG